ncbi:v-type proton ATPase 16 kDa proteolipid subunit [Phtheirospermum japonicum]|uniref:V-type proton ATPase proteolipid subunit n=1 Tax=Phtheirospermum japonicum TaxID=374723 RepID=A0A830D5S9_9LAMI|nr:v-type proton ATPase 16 kDa proteolipid subunit [Phtheirospermum japonicum]
MGVMRPELVMKSIVPVVMAGVLGIYGLIIAVIISIGINPKPKSYYLFDGYAHLSSGLACGLAAGMVIGIVGDGVMYDDLFDWYRDFYLLKLKFDLICFFLVIFFLVIYLFIYFCFGGSERSPFLLQITYSYLNF